MAALNYDRIVGRDNWKYISQIDSIDEKNAGTVKLSPAELRHWALTIEHRMAWCARYSIHYSFLIAPNKASIYPEFLEVCHRPIKKRDLMTLKAYLAANSDAYLLDPTERLLAAKANRDLYYHNDEHWNHYGAFLAYEMLMEDINTRLNIAPITSDKLVVRHGSIIGDLEAMAEKPEPEHTDFLSVRDGTSREVYVNKTGGRGKIQIFEGTDKNLPRAVMFRDSYGSKMLPFINETFSRVVVVSNRSLMFDLLQHEKPDVVIHELCERYLDPVPDDIRGKPFDEYCNTLLSELPAITR